MPGVSVHALGNKRDKLCIPLLELSFHWETDNKQVKKKKSL